MATRAPSGDDDPTLTTPGPTPPSAPDEGRFLPGTILAQRYRIVSLLGRGGMGEVYRATDLLLGQAVALKFLPPATAGDEAALSRFRDEVRIARQVSHPNVCRVYDIGEAAGLVFLSMEYVDGEDLAALLHRIGHLPPDKAVEVARELCAGLHAAHEKGVIHRDLKPANIMLDGHGRVRVMDFGLASLAAQNRDVRGGTPAYMAPEQKAGIEASARSDIYSLGVVLHELYTGKRPAEAPTSPTSLDPAVDRIIQRCLSDDPNRRPATALAVAAALPGGDPLEVALAAGETPSPEMVANAGPVEGMPVWKAALCLAALAVSLVGIFLLSAARPRNDLIPIESPEVLTTRAREYIRALGYDYAGADSAVGFEDNYPVLGKLFREKKGAQRASALKSLEPPALTFWYRQHPVALAVPQLRFVTREDPWFSPGSIEVVVDPKGRLVEFHAAPPPRKPYKRGQVPDWSQLFTLAGLDSSRFHLAEPEFTPRTICDQRMAWTGSYPSSPGLEVRVEAAAYEGRVSTFRVIVPELPVEQPVGERLHGQPNFLLVFLVVVPLASLAFAWRNIARGSADWRGASRLCAVTATCHFLGSLLLSHHVASLEGAVLLNLLLYSTYVPFFCGVAYLAFEPYVRRWEPWSLVSWSRLLEGRWRDPRIGSDVLAGTIAWGLGALAMSGVALLLDLEILPIITLPLSVIQLSGMALRGGVITALMGGLLLLLLFASMRFFIRRRWLAASVAVAMFALLVNPQRWSIAILPFWVILFLLLGRFGLLAVTSMLFVQAVAATVPLTLDFTKWYVWQGITAVLLILALALYGFWANLGGRPLWRDEEDTSQTANHAVS